MLFSLLPVTVLAIETHTHDLTVTKEGGTPVAGTADSHESADYYWNDNELHILTDGLTVSDTTEAEYIVVEDGVTSLALDGVTIAPTEYINWINRAITSYSEALTITLVGHNQIGNKVIYSEGTEELGYEDATEYDDYLVKTGVEGNDLTFTGSGSLTIYDRKEGISCNGSVTFDQNFKGTLTIED